MLSLLLRTSPVILEWALTPCWCCLHFALLSSPGQCALVHNIYTYGLGLFFFPSFSEDFSVLCHLWPSARCVPRFHSIGWHLFHSSLKTLKETYLSCLTFFPVEIWPPESTKVSFLKQVPLFLGVREGKTQGLSIKNTLRWDTAQTLWSTRMATWFPQFLWFLFSHVLWTVLLSTHPQMWPHRSQTAKLNLDFLFHLYPWHDEGPCLFPARQEEVSESFWASLLTFHSFT